MLGQHARYASFLKTLEAPFTVRSLSLEGSLFLYMCYLAALHTAPMGLDAVLQNTAELDLTVRDAGSDDEQLTVIARSAPSSPSRKPNSKRKNLPIRPKTICARWKQKLPA